MLVHLNRNGLSYKRPNNVPYKWSQSHTILLRLNYFRRNKGFAFVIDNFLSITKWVLCTILAPTIRILICVLSRPQRGEGVRERLPLAQKRDHSADCGLLILC